MEYFANIFKALGSLINGMRVTGYYFTHHKNIITQQYPNNREKLLLPERFKGEVVLLHNENNEHKCTGCTACEIACPNGTIKIITKTQINEEGKKKKALDTFVYHISLCTFCSLCIEACPTSAIKMGQNFEFAAFTRPEQTHILNKEGSKLESGIE